FKFVLLLGTIISIFMALHAKELAGPNRGEFFLLLTATCLGGMFLSSATNLLMIYLSLESLSIISYALAGYLRQDRKSAEAGIKYVIYGAMASGIMIFGMSYLYGITGTLSLYDTAGAPGVPKAAGLAALIRATFAFFPSNHKAAGAPLPNVETVIVAISVLTMTVGNLA